MSQTNKIENNNHSSSNHSSSNHNSSNHSSSNHSSSNHSSWNAPSNATPSGSTFIALDVSYQLIESLVPIVPIIAQNDRQLADQISRAANSISLNLGEGQRSIKGNRHKHYALAHGSANEVKAALFVAKAWRWIDSSSHALAILDRLLALLWRLTHPRPS
jgi:four helix bundle protein